MSKVCVCGGGGLSVHEVGELVIIYIFILNSSGIGYYTFFMTTSNFGGGGVSPPYQKVGKPPLPPRISASDLAAA